MDSSSLVLRLLHVYILAVAILLSPYLLLDLLATQHSCNDVLLCDLMFVYLVYLTRMLPIGRLRQYLVAVGYVRDDWANSHFTFDGMSLWC